MRNLVIILFIAFTICFQSIGFCQYIERVEFKTKDNVGITYLAIKPRSNSIKGTVVIFSCFTNLTWLTAQTKIHNVSFDNNLLVVYATLDDKFFADSSTIDRMNIIFNHIITKFNVDDSKFVLGAIGIASNVILRYTELSQQFSTGYSTHPKAIFCTDCYSDLFSFWYRLENKIQTNYDKNEVDAAKTILDLMSKKIGSIYRDSSKYQDFSPFHFEQKSIGHERYLKNIPIRLYYDIDAEWQLKKRNSFFDTNIPEGSELIKRLLLLGNREAEFITSKQPGIRSDAVKDPASLSVIDEVDCVHWIKQKLDIFDYNTWIPKYNMVIPKNWRPERHAIPTPWAPDMTYTGVLDMRFPAGWRDSTSKECWSYTHLWWLDEHPKIDEVNLKENLIKYFFGLSGGNRRNPDIPDNKFIPTTVSIQKVKTAINDIETYSGIITTFDSHVTYRALKLNCRVHVRKCSEQKKYELFLEFSPHPFEHEIWKEFITILESFDCSK
jgi:hypothetical protein